MWKAFGHSHKGLQNWVQGCAGAYLMLQWHKEQHPSTLQPCHATPAHQFYQCCANIGARAEADPDL